MSQPSWIGQTLSARYQIEALLGQGGMSEVYKAYDPNLKRQVAIKLIHSHLSSDPDFIQRFEEEAAAIASLRHPNIIQVYDFNSDGDVHYMVLEYVQGESLYSLLQHLSTEGKKLPIEDAIKFGVNICDALTYAHQHGMIHRDIKPANIMISSEGQAILMDFGIVKIVGATSHTATGAVLGTARYISPELVRSEPADPRSDIYSLGITLYEMLSGRTPFQSDSTLTLMMMHLNEPVPDPRSLRADLPAELVNILYKTLEKDPASRYQNAADMVADLKEALLTIQNGALQSPQAAAPPPPGTLAEPGPTTKPLPAIQAGRPWLFGLGGGLLVLCLALAALGVFWMRGQYASSARTPAAPTTAVAEVLATNAPANPSAQISGQLEATATAPNYYVRILGIKRRGSQYEVQYETNGFTEKLPWMHIHFFFNNVTPEQAGKPGNGPYFIYGGPRPFSGYSISQTPEGATQMCALVANPDHSIIPGSGNCVDLPAE